MENFLEFLRIEIIVLFLILITYCLIRLIVLYFVDWRNLKKQMKQDCLVIYYANNEPDYIPLNTIEEILFDSTFYVFKIGIKGKMGYLRVSNSATLKIEKVETKYIKQL